MPNDRDSFLQALRAEPENDQLALIFADWLEENGDDARAELIRVNVEVHGQEQPHRDHALWARYKQALTPLVEEFRIKVAPEEWMWHLSFRFRRGFVHHLELPVRWLVEWSDAIEREAPLLEKLTVGRVHGWGKQLAQCPLLEKITELEVESWISVADAKAIASSPHLKQLQSLEIWLGEGGREDTNILKAFAQGAKNAYPELNELRIIAIPGCSQKTVDSANRHLGRPIAKAVLPDPRLYPLTADFSTYLFAGHLPDSTQLLVEAPYIKQVPCRLLHFTPDGQQISVEELPLPPECLPDLEDRWGDAHVPKVREYLERERDFKPGIIYVQHISHPTENFSLGNGDHECMGYPDDPDEAPENWEEPMGNTTGSVHWLKEGDYTFWYGSPVTVSSDGKVVST